VPNSAAGVSALTSRALVRRNLVHYWRTNLAVVAGVVTTVAVLTGALLVGDSVRASLRALVLLRIGNTSFVISAGGFFPESLAQRLAADPSFGTRFQSAVPLMALEGVAIHEKSGRRAARVAVYGVDGRFWDFHGLSQQVSTPTGRELLLSEALARELEAASGDTILIRIQKPSEAPLDSLHGRRDDVARAIRSKLRGALPAASLGEFSLQPRQGAVRAVFLPLSRLQDDLKQNGKANSILVSEVSPSAHSSDSGYASRAALSEILRKQFAPEDLGLRLRFLPAQGAVSLESEKILVDDQTAATVLGKFSGPELRASEIFTYLAVSIRANGREIPYSLVTGMDLTEASAAPLHVRTRRGASPPLLLNQWALRDLGARIGDTVTLEYFVWEQSGRLRTASAEFSLAGVAHRRFGEDRDLAPAFPGITESESLGGWDPPFPVDLTRVRPGDEGYWKKYRTAPKAFIPLDEARRLWGTRHGLRTSLRIADSTSRPLPAGLPGTVTANLLSVLDPSQAGLAIQAVRGEGQSAAQGAVNFGEYFLYFSFFLVVSGVLLTGLFFKLGVEQRLREIGLLQALGFDPGRILKIFFAEAALLSLFGTLIGLLAAAGYAALMMYGLRTWWVDAVGTTLLRLHIEPASLVAGALAGISAALLATAWALRGLRGVSTRSLLHGEPAPANGGRPRARWPFYAALGSALGAASLLTLSFAGQLNPVGGFFGAGALLLAAVLSFEWHRLSRSESHLLAGHGLAALVRFGARNARWRPGRSLLCIGLLASATFIITAVDSFRRSAVSAQPDAHSGTGGYALLAESLFPVPYDPGTPAGLESLNFSDTHISTLAGIRVVPFRVRPGDDTSCLNLYQPRNPRILGVPASFSAAGRFSFRASLARTPEERRNPWLILEAALPDGSIPAILDANSMTYVLRLRLGDEFLLPGPAGAPLRFKIVAALADSIFQSELLISEKNLLRLFPGDASTQGYRFFLAEVPASRAGQVASALEEGLEEYGLDAQPAGERLAAYHRVENTYISTFQVLGGLGLLLGTVGLAAVLLRNVFERRRELALLRAVGYRPADLAWLVMAENAFLLSSGLFSGVASALVAIAPALAERGGGPAFSAGILLALTVLTGLVASLAAVAAVIRSPLLPVLRSE